ncbi:MAG: sulfur carrier protein ThiS [Candidatus Glassbacteria bacterium]|nr:sulfur carrier protein ThiS [Candidatus Glassbacteria bacterium]
MTVTVNGEKRQLVEGSTVADLLADIGIRGRRLAVERNRETVSRDSYRSTPVRDGDVYEVVVLIGGGS